MNNFFSGRGALVLPVAALLAVFVALFYFMRRQPGPYHALPSQAALVMEFDGPDKCKQLKKITNDPLWQAVFETTALQNAWQDEALIEAVFQQDVSLTRALAERKLLVGLTLNKADSLHGLFVLETDNDPDLPGLLNNNTFVRKVFPSVFHGHTIYNLHLPGNERMFVGAVGPLLLFSRFSYLIEDAISQINGSSSWWADRKLLPELDANAPFRLYFRPEMIKSRYAGSMNPAWKQAPEMLTQNLEWLGVSWNGITAGALAETRGFAGGMSTWGKGDGDAVAAVLPDNTALVVRAVFEHPRSFFKKLEPVENPGFEQFVLPWIGNELAWGMTEPFSPGIRDEQFLALAVRDSAAALGHLHDYGRQHGILRLDDYQTFEVIEFADPSILTPLTGGNAGFRNLCCAMIGQYVVFTGNRASIELLIDKYIVNQTLSNNTDFLQLRQKAPPGDEGAWLLLQAGYLPQLLKNLLDPERETPDGPDVQAFEKAGFVGMTLRSELPGTLKIKLAAQPRTEQPVAASILWKTPLSDVAITQPWVISNATDGGDTRILVQDARFQLYCLDAGGAIVWRRQMEGPILSTLEGIDYWNNRNKCFLFNTPDRIWLLDGEGQEVERFPLELLSPATNGVVVVDFDNNLKFNYFVACSNGNIYGYDQFGRPLPGWNPQGGVGRVKQPLRHFQHNNKDYLAVLNESGKLFVYGRNGRERFPAVRLEGSNFGPLQVDVVSRAPRIVCANGAGKIFVCNLEGGVFGIPSGLPGKLPARLVFLQLEGDARFEYVLAREKQVVVRAYSGASLQTKHEIRVPVNQDTVFALSNRRYGTLSRSRRQIYLFDENGTLRPDFPLAGTTPFAMSGPAGKNTEQILIVGDGASVYAYKLKQ